MGRDFCETDFEMEIFVQNGTEGSSQFSTCPLSNEGGGIGQRGVWLGWIFNTGLRWSYGEFLTVTAFQPPPELKRSKRTIRSSTPLVIVLGCNRERPCLEWRVMLVFKMTSAEPHCQHSHKMGDEVLVRHGVLGSQGYTPAFIANNVCTTNTSGTWGNKIDRNTCSSGACTLTFFTFININCP